MNSGTNNVTIYLEQKQTKRVTKSEKISWENNNLFMHSFFFGRTIENMYREIYDQLRAIIIKRLN